MNTLAVDQGTSSTKALVVAHDGSILSCVDAAVRPIATHDGGVEQDPEALWLSVLEAGAAAVAQAGVPIGVVGLANQGETVLAWDPATGSPLTPAISWQDRRAVSVTRRMAADADGLRELTGLPLDPYFAAPKMAWIRENLTRDGVVTTSDAWLIHRLTGRFATDATTASRTMLLDLDTVTWSSAAVELFGLGSEQLPEVVPCGGVIGETTSFGPSVPLAGLATDQQAALFGDGCHIRGAAKCTYGTGAFLLANAGDVPTRSGSGLATSVAWQLEGKADYCLDGQVFTAGAAVRWLQDLGLITGPADLDALGDSVASSEGVHFVPGLAGLAAPFWRPDARGAFTGLSLATSRGHLVRAFIDGIAASIAWLVRAAEADLGQPLGRLIADGGLTASRCLMQAQANLAQVPIDVFATPHATALGVAAMARVGVGERRQALQMTTGWTPAATYEPRITADEAAERLDGWRSAAQATLQGTGAHQ
jgi:glycerol kinase